MLLKTKTKLISDKSIYHFHQKIGLLTRKIADISKHVRALKEDIVFFKLIYSFTFEKIFQVLGSNPIKRSISNKDRKIPTILNLFF